MAEDSVTVPPEVRDGLKRLQDAGALHDGQRDRAIERAEEEGEEATVKWLRQVGPSVYERAAQGRFVGGDER
jgi:hypothetical protein